LFGTGIGIGGQGLARTAPSLLRRRDSVFSFSLDFNFVLVLLNLIVVSRKRLARTASSLLRSSFGLLIVFGGGRKRLARTASSLLRSSFGLLFLLSIVVNRSGLLRAASGFLCGSFVFLVRVGSLLTTSLLRSWLGRLLFIIVVVSLGLSGTAAFLASRFLRVAIFSTLGVVSKL
jgi:hypothetical protein